MVYALYGKRSLSTHLSTTYKLQGPCWATQRSQACSCPQGPRSQVGLQRMQRRYLMNDVWGAREGFTKELTLTDFLNHVEAGNVKGRAGSRGGSPLGLLLLLQQDQPCFHLLHTIGFQMKIFFQKKSLYSHKNKFENPSITHWNTCFTIKETETQRSGLCSDPCSELSPGEFSTGRAEGFPRGWAKRGREGILQEAPPLRSTNTQISCSTKN